MKMRQRMRQRTGSHHHAPNTNTRPSAELSRHCRILQNIIMCDWSLDHIWRISRTSLAMTCEGSIYTYEPHVRVVFDSHHRYLRSVPIMDKRHGGLSFQINLRKYLYKAETCSSRHPNPWSWAPNIAAARKPCHIAVGKNEGSHLISGSWTSFNSFPGHY
jgi:hypothetical protein